MKLLHILKLFLNDGYLYDGVCLWWIASISGTSYCDNNYFSNDLFSSSETVKGHSEPGWRLA